MKASELYREGARLVHEGKAYFSCTAIYMLKRKKPMSEEFFRTNDPEALALSYLFQNPKYKNTLYRGVFGNPRNPKNQELRVLAMCFMAAIAESDEKEFK
jgi:hypothetical protein